MPLNKLVVSKLLTKNQAKTYFQNKYPNVEYELSEVILDYITTGEMTCEGDRYWYFPVNDLARQIKIYPKFINDIQTKDHATVTFEPDSNYWYWFANVDDTCHQMKWGDESFNWQQLCSGYRSFHRSITYYRFTIKDTNKQIYINSAFSGSHGIRYHEIE